MIGKREESLNKNDPGISSFEIIQCLQIINNTRIKKKWLLNKDQILGNLRKKTI